MKFKAYIETLGCAKNQVDSEVMMGMLSDNEYYLTNDVNEADIVIVNTCGFIESAKQESVNTILDLVELKKEGNCKFFIVTGCLSERYSEELAKEIPEVDAFLGTTKFDEIIKTIDSLLEGTEYIESTGNIDKIFEENMPRTLSTPSYTAYLKIAEGCDNFCTYCIIPKLRGKYRSRKMEDIIAEAKKLADGGVKEIIVIAQDTTRYGIDIYGEYKLAELLDELNKIEGLKWIRLQYMYPDIVDEKLIDSIAKNDKVCNYIDMPIQHASNRVLKLMNRTTTKERINEIIDMIRVKIPTATIRSTLIVGFPGETEEDFSELLDFVENAKINRLGAFKYSKEEDTAAFNLPNQLDEDVKEDRLFRLMNLQKDVSEEIMENFLHTEVEVLIEEQVQGEDVFIGRTMGDAPEIDGVVYVNTKEELEIGELYKVKVTDTLEYDLIGEKI